MDEFKKQGGALGGREERSDFFKGEPRSFGGHDVRDDCGPEPSTTDSTHRNQRTTHETPIADQHMGSSSGLGSSGVDRDGYKPGATGQHVGTDGQIGYVSLII